MQITLVSITACTDKLGTLKHGGFMKDDFNLALPCYASKECTRRT